MPPLLLKFRVAVSLEVSDDALVADQYVFIDEWDVDAPQEQVFDVLVDSRTYPEWWTPTYVGGESDGPPKPGTVSRVRFKAKLPFTFTVTSRLVRVDRPNEFETLVEGDLGGVAVWTLTPRNGKVHVRFDWRVSADHPLIRFLTPVLRPIFRWNHKMAIGQAKRNLEPYVRRRAGL
ncbi:MAG: hypothetical protein K0S98_2972 [Propionibacteriaceae bacterium]|nr:hypothetical protein [Propionibacteriaceae bacterium]